MFHSTKSVETIDGRINSTPTLTNRFYQVTRNFQFKGAKTSLSHYFRRARHILLRVDENAGEPGPVACDERFAAENPDARLDDLVIQSPNAKWGLPYAPTHEEFFHRVMRSLPVPLEDYTFIDLGAGKGLALLLASGYSFKSIIGVEYSRRFTDMACQNIRAYQEQGRSHPSVRCVCGDASDFELPMEPTILYLFNPFQGKVMDRVIANIERSLRSTPRDLWIVYHVPWEGRKFQRNPMFETIEWNSEFSLHRSIHRYCAEFE
jgi:hypothetical protein